MRPSELFLSHASDDHVQAGRLADVLRRHGVPVWFAPSEIRGAQQWHDEIGAALRRCDWFALVLSPGACDSMWVKRELLFALNDPRYRDRIVPLLVRACNHSSLSWTLDAYQRVDLSVDFDAGCRELLRIWGIGFIPA